MTFRGFISSACTLTTLSLLLSAASAGCSTASEDDAESGERAPIDRCDEEGVSCAAYGRKDPSKHPAAYELGTGDGSPRSVTFTVVAQVPTGYDPVDLEFNPTRSKEMWVVDYAASAVTIVTNVGAAGSRVQSIRDPAYAHFMNRPPAMAFGIDSASGYGREWATCGDNNNGGNNFMGPTLYSADPALMGRQTEGGLGTHLDMLHSTPFCRGITWAGKKSTFFAFNAQSGSIEYYDFSKNHEPGADDHSDGIIHRYWNKQVKGVNGLVSHLSYDTATRRLYVADTGNGRILALDPALGRPVAPIPGANENIKTRAYHEAPVKVLVAPGILQAPSGIEASGGLAFVTDAATSTIYAFDLADGKLVRKLATGLPRGALAGLNFGPEGKIYFVDRIGSRVVRIDP